MGDTGNWEFAAVVAAVVMGLGGLLIFTVISTIGSWRVFRLAAQASRESGSRGGGSPGARAPHGREAGSRAGELFGTGTVG